MSNSQNNRYISCLEIKPKYTLPQPLSSPDTSELIQSTVKDITHQNEVIPDKIQNYSESYKEFNEYKCNQLFTQHILPITRAEIPLETVISDSPQSLISKPSDDEKSIEDLIEHMENEEKRMRQEIESMKHGEERMKYEIIFMKYRESRMELDIELMRRREKPVEEILLIQTPIFDNEESMNNEFERMKKREKHMIYEIERMKHYETRLIDETRSIENEIKRIQYLSTLEHHGAFHQSEIEFTNHAEKLEELCNELTKRETKLREHSNEINKREIKLKEHFAERMGCKNELEMIRNKVKQELERVEREKQFRREAIQRRKYFENLLAERHAERLGLQIELLKSTVERVVDELRLMEDDEKRRENLILYRRLNEELPIKWNKFYTLREAEETHLVKNLYCREIRTFTSDEVDIRREEFKMLHIFSDFHADYEVSTVINQPKYDIFISSAYQNDYMVERIKNTIQQRFSIHIKGNLSSTNIKICLDNTNTAVIAIINKAYELSATCQADMIHIFKRQFPLVLVISDNDFTPSTNWLNLVWQISSTQKVLLDISDFEKKLHNAITDAEWNLSPNPNVSNIAQPTTYERSKRFLGDFHEWTVACSNPAQVSHNYRQLINDPLRINTNTKLRDIYYSYICMYFENSDVMSLCKEGANENDIHHFIRAYTHTGPFSTSLNHHLAANILFYFVPKLHDTVDYQLVKCLIDFVALCIYRQELSQHVFRGTAYRGLVMSEEDLFKYIVGSRIMNTSFLSTSKDKEVAEFFSGQNEQEFAVLCTFIIYNNRNRRTALDISYISYFPHEREVLILPFSAFYVQSVTRPSDRSRPIEMMLVEDDLDTGTY